MIQRAETYHKDNLREWFLNFADTHPEIYNLDRLQVCYKHVEAELGENINNSQVVAPLLRAALLRELHKNVSNCDSCALSVNRLAGRPVLDDGDVSNDIFHQVLKDRARPVGATTAKIFMFAEGPGQYEQRTGQPQVSYQVLAGSSCATACGNFEACYPFGCKIPAKACEPVRPQAKNDNDLIQLIVKPRANAKPWRLHTAGQVLDECLMAAGLWRENWNPRLRYMDNTKLKVKPGNVYNTNVVKCRACVQNPDHPLKLQDVAPPKEAIDACNNYFELQLEIIQPLVMVALGAVAVTASTKKNKIKMTGETRTTLHKGPNDIPIIADVHPSFILRQGSSPTGKAFAEGLIDNLKRARAIANGEEKVTWPSPLEKVVAALPTDIILQENFAVAEHP